uniref:Uncharacterized protein n=1 Tax=Panagrolaimus sp. PS1159 TaxID=55785 RepID=A0AC35GRJ0_9BILA
MNKFGNYVQLKPIIKEKSKEEEDKETKEAFMAFVQNFFNVKNVEPGDLKAKIKKMHIYICKLQGEKYDLEKHLELQSNYIKETKESMNGTDNIDPLTGAIRPSKINVFKKYDRQTDHRNYAERRKMFEKESEQTGNMRKQNEQISKKSGFQNKCH